MTMLIGREAEITPKFESCSLDCYVSHTLLLMTLEMTLVYPVQWGVAIRRTRLTPCASPMFCFVFFFPAIREIIM